MKTQQLFLMIFMTVTMNTQAASFNCTQSSTQVDKQICHNPYLSKTLDYKCMLASDIGDGAAKN